MGENSKTNSSHFSPSKGAPVHKRPSSAKGSTGSARLGVGGLNDLVSVVTHGIASAPSLRIFANVAVAGVPARFEGVLEALDAPGAPAGDALALLSRLGLSRGRLGLGRRFLGRRITRLEGGLLGGVDSSLGRGRGLGLRCFLGDVTGEVAHTGLPAVAAGAVDVLVVLLVATNSPGNELVTENVEVARLAVGRVAAGREAGVGVGGGLCQCWGAESRDGSDQLEDLGKLHLVGGLWLVRQG